MHGYSKLFDKDGTLRRVGWFSSGRLKGLVWLFLVGGGCLVGEVGVMGTMIGDDIAFLYPDRRTALLGTFAKGKMLVAQTAFVQMATVRDEICQLKFTQPRGPFYSYDQSNRELISKEPLLRDPYEAQYCYVKNSRLKGAKEGLFAKKDLPPGFVVCFYNGIRLRSDELDKDIENWESNAYKIIDMQGQDESGLEGILDIPPEMISLKRYHASLAHKVNHR